jgi:hypothetical protein
VLNQRYLGDSSGVCRIIVQARLSFVKLQDVATDFVVSIPQP